MNTYALLIYSFLMREEIQFIRYCHDAYSDYATWEAMLKKSKKDVAIPQVTAYVQESSEIFLLYLHITEKAPSFKKEGWEPLSAGSGHDRLIQLLRCQTHTISPLGLYFDTKQQCRLYIDTKICQEKMLCLSPCSDCSSVLITPTALLEEFLPATGHTFTVDGN